MAECHGDIVYRKDRTDIDCSVAHDNSALLKAYERAVRSFQGSMSEGEDSVNGKKEKSESGSPSDGSEQGTTAEQPQWAVGCRCRAIWSEDGMLYPAELLSVEGERGTVKFDGYGNEEEVELSALLSEGCDQPSGEIQVRRPLNQQWVLGCRCRAVWSEDGLVYPAVLVWEEGGCGRVQFEGYGNEEELDLSALLPPEEPKSGMSDIAAAQVEETGPASCGNTDWRKENSAPSREDSAITLPSGCTTGVARSRYRSRGEPRKEQGRKTTGSWEEERTLPFNFFPPVPPPPESSLGALPLNPPPPPPPPCAWPPRGGPGGGVEDLDSDVTELSTMLLSWYFCGYHTGCYMATQQANAGRRVREMHTVESPLQRYAQEQQWDRGHCRH
ncbi:hypothetical protein AAFF_G00258490 [Aldrovandia affinis]|uniref:Tudor domain-containing protein n=1 Tax=Aldrovandia affinis TaxID=143900 RepID=A0AAD7WTH7_9TELE|nr:hypothetical protein AAFF_G00258490 [Aldrovandia affinis]